MLFWRFLIASIILLPIILITKSYRGNNKKSLFRVYLSGALFYSLSCLSFFIGSLYIGTGLSMVLYFTFPLFVVLGFWFFDKKKITYIEAISIGITLIGLVMLVEKEEVNYNFTGIFVGIIGAICYAVYVYLSQKQISNTNTFMMSLMVALGNGSFFLIASFFHGSFYVPQTSQLWLDVIILGTICTALPILFFQQGLKYISPSKASIMSVLEPIFAVLIGAFVLREQINIFQVVGIVLIIAGSLIIQFDKDGALEQKK
jgi:drug/metabolite transporter (DMT)-like permease